MDAVPLVVMAVLAVALIRRNERACHEQHRPAAQEEHRNTEHDREHVVALLEAGKRAAAD